MTAPSVYLLDASLSREQFALELARAADEGAFAEVVPAVPLRDHWDVIDARLDSIFGHARPRGEV